LSSDLIGVGIPKHIYTFNTSVPMQRQNRPNIHLSYTT